MEANEREYDTTLLHVAVDCRESNIVRLLAKYGADLGAEDRHGVTALGVAVVKGAEDIEGALRSAGAAEQTGAALKLCPDGHRSLRDVPVLYGLFLGRRTEPESRASDYLS